METLLSILAHLVMVATVSVVEVVVLVEKEADY